jgi:hypothetical protein
MTNSFLVRTGRLKKLEETKASRQEYPYDGHADFFKLEINNSTRKREVREGMKNLDLARQVRGWCSTSWCSTK